MRCAHSAWACLPSAFHSGTGAFGCDPGGLRFIVFFGAEAIKITFNYLILRVFYVILVAAELAFLVEAERPSWVRGLWRQGSDTVFLPCLFDLRE